MSFYWHKQYGARKGQATSGKLLIFIENPESI